ncbi:hypothetical protein D3C80_1615150 [compost metagenome]
MTQWSRIGQLCTRIHVSLIIIFYNNHAMIAKRCTDSRPHADVHAAVAGNHNKCKIILKAKLIKLASTLAFPEHFYDPGQGCRSVLEQVMDVGCFMGGIRISGRNNHRAACMEQSDDIALDPFEEQFKP